MRSARAVSTLALVATAAALAAAPPVSAKRAELPRFQTCGQLVDFGRRAVVRPPLSGWLPAIWDSEASIDPRALQADPGPQPKYPPSADGVPAPMPASAAGDAAAAGGGAGESASSTTNVQEAGVDEPDAIKVAGTRLYMIVGQELLAVDTAGATPQVVGRLPLAARGGALLVRGEKLLLLGPTASSSALTPDVNIAAPTQVPAPPTPVPVPAPDVATSISRDPQRNPRSLLQEIDISDPANLRVLRSMEVPGTVTSARMADGVARIVVNSIATLPELPDDESGLAPRLARKLSRAAFVPRTVVSSKVTGKTYRRDLVACRQVRHPQQPTGTNLVTVLSVDLDRGLINVDRDGVLAAAQTVYASTSALYVAASRAAAVDPQASVPSKPVTEIHRFPYAGRETEYGGGGTVRGVLLNHYSLSEHAGKLRVATSDAPLWWSRPEDENQLTVLEPRGRTLSQLGYVGGLGQNERIYAARLIGDRGYLVTFRRTDPLYVLDLSDPAAPKATGELKIPGYSAYLHPLPGDLLLGVGQDGTDGGQITGPQLSLFDVKDPAKPARIAQHKPAGYNWGEFLAERDPHAFLWWPATGDALLPLSQRYLGWGSQSAPLLSVRPSRAAGLRETGRHEHGAPWDRPEIERVAIAGGKVVAISDLGVSTAETGSLATTGWMGFVE